MNRCPLLLLLAWLGGATIAESQCGPSGCYVRPAPPRQESAAVSAALRRAYQAVARIVHDEGAGSSVGSGALIANDRQGSWFLTCAHLFDGPGKTRVVLGGATATARVVAIDREHDLALLQSTAFRAEPVSVTAVRPAGELTACGFGGTGVFRSVRGPIVGQATATGARYPSFRIRGAVRSGDSGGPVFNARGRLVAVIWGERGGETYAMGGEPLRRILQRLTGSQQPTKLSPVPRATEPAKGCDCEAWRKAIEGRLALLDQRPAPRLPNDLIRHDDLSRVTATWEQRFARLESRPLPPAPTPQPPRSTTQVLGDWLSRKAMLAAIAGGAPAVGAGVLAWRLWRRSRTRAGTSEMTRPIAVDSPPPPQQVVPETHYVSYERDEFARAHQWACEQLARKFPGSVELLSSLDSLIKQQLNGNRES